MLKLGIRERRAFLAPDRSGILSRLRHWFAKSRVSLDLLRMPHDPTSEDIEVFERLMAYVRLSSGVYRTTHRGRFRNLDPLVNSLLAESFPPSVRLRVEDWAASDCFTSFEWAQSLFPLFPALDFVASDSLLFLAELENSESGEQFVLEPDGKLLQYIRPPFVVRMEPPESWLFPLSRLLYLLGQKRWKRASSSFAIPDDWADSPGNHSLKTNGFTLRALSLIHPEAVRLAGANSGFRVRRHSVFDTLSESCHVIRLMNILNRAYFPQELLSLGCRNALDALYPGGLSIIGRTVNENPPEHHATIFRKTSGGDFEVLQRIGPGSEIESIAVAARHFNK